MTHEGFDKNLREYYGEYRLRSDSADRLKRMIRAGNESARQKRRRTTWIVVAAFAASIAVAIALTAAFTVDSRLVPARDVSAAVAREAAICHVRDYGPEVDVTSYGEVRRRLAKLDFVPVEPQRLRGSATKVVGARYVTLESQPAVALMLENPSGTPCTLFEARPAERLDSVRDGRWEIDGLTVDVWREKGLVMVLAQ